MPPFLQSGVDWLYRQVEKHASEEILYTRGTQTIQIRAVPAAVDVELLTESEFIDRGRMLDWIVRAALIVFDGVHSEPQSGDRIERTAGGLASTYEVAPIVGNTHFRPADSHGVAWRIHSKLIAGTAPA